MGDKANYFKLGLFVIIALALGTLALAMLGAGEFLKQEFLVETCFDESVQGLDVGSSVKYKGIEIGKVKTITSAAGIYQARTDYVLVIISLTQETRLGQTGSTIQDRIANAIKDGLTIRLALQGLTGTAYLETDYTGNGKEIRLSIPWKPIHPYIPSEPNKITQLGESLDRILKNLDAINLQGMAFDLSDLMVLISGKIKDVNMKAISRESEALLREIRTTNGKLEIFLDSEKTEKLFTRAQAALTEFQALIHDAAPPLQTALEGFKTTSVTTSRLVAKLDKNLDSRLADLREELEGILKNLNQTTQTINDLVWVNSGNIDDTIQNLKTTSENLRQMSYDIKRYPARLLLEKPPGPSVKEEKR